MKIGIVWLRRDLRLEDNTALHHALESGLPILPIFIFDDQILELLPDNDPRVNFIYDRLELMNNSLKSYNSGILIKKGKVSEVWNELLKEYDVSGVFFNRDYEPYARKRDAAITDLINASGAEVKTYKDQVIFEENEVLKDDGKPYTVFTPYSRKWKRILQDNPIRVELTSNFAHLLPHESSFPSKDECGIKESPIKVRPIDHSRVHKYADQRNFPKHKTTDIGPHLRFGTVSIRQVFNDIPPSNEAYRNELIWREFFMQILFHFPNSATDNFKSKYDHIEWRNKEEEFEKWCKGETGYPMVDAGMRELNETGYMHGRVRMVTASFLCKHLLIDWRWGEAYFAKKLLDFELSSNVGNWQWSAGTGCDAAPYFRVFNPIEQLKKFDKDMSYVRKWVPEMDELTYVPMVDHKMARERCLATYKEGLIDRVF